MTATVRESHLTRLADADHTMRQSITTARVETRVALCVCARARCENPVFKEVSHLTMTDLTTGTKRWHGCIVIAATLLSTSHCVLPVRELVAVDSMPERTWPVWLRRAVAATLLLLLCPTIIRTDSGASTMA